MKSANPNSGFHETQVAACLDTTTPDPSKAQGGNVIISTNSNGEDVAATLTRDLAKQTGAQQQNGGRYCLIRRIDIGGLGDEREVSPTLSHKPSALEPTAAIYPACADTLRRRNDEAIQPDKQNGAAFVAQAQCDLSQMRYIVRRLTPTEAERLMGLPDGYTIPTGLRRFFDANGEPAPELVAEFQRIFDTFGAIMAEYEHKPAPKPKSANQVRAWLEKITDPATCPDSPRYKACGNGWATNQPRWILTRLLAIGEQIDPFTGESYAD
jgi:hypothetical protein